MRDPYFSRRREENKTEVDVMAELRTLRIPSQFFGVVLMTSLLVGCANYPVTYFPAQIGQKWDMVADETGDITHFEIVMLPHRITRTR
jgi:hypothetical protein